MHGFSTEFYGGLAVIRDDIGEMFVDMCSRPETLNRTTNVFGSFASYKSELPSIQSIGDLEIVP